MDDLSGAVGKGVQPPDGTTERDAARYRWLCEQVAFGSWSIGIHEVIDKFGITDDTYIDDKADADATIDAAMLVWPSMSTTTDGSLSSGSGASGEGVRAPDGDTERLMRFYSVGTVEELIAAQARHIEKLQAKLPPSPSFRPTFPRG